MRASYLTYKSTSIPWLPEMPEHWELRKIKYIFKLVTEQAEANNDYELLSLYTEIGVRPRKELEEKGNKASTTDFYWLVKKGDIIVNKLLAWMGAIGMSNYDGVTSPAYDVLRKTLNVNVAYFDYLFRSGILLTDFRRRSKGIMDMRLRLYFDELGQIKVPCPPPSEQTAIANYLDAKTEQINRFIPKKEKLIALLKEQKRSLTTEIIQKEERNIEKIKLKYCVRNVSIQTSQMAKDDIYLGMENVESWTGLYVESDQKDFESQAKMFQFNDVLFGKLRPYLAKVFLANIKGVCSGEFLVLRPSKKIAPEYLQLVLLDPEFISLVNSSTFGAKMPRADWGFIGNQLISLPSIAQQKQIVAMIKSEGETIDKVIGRIEMEIEKVKELKQSLIAEAVTGRIKVS